MEMGSDGVLSPTYNYYTLLSISILSQMKEERRIQDFLNKKDTTMDNSEAKEEKQEFIERKLFG